MLDWLSLSLEDLLAKDSSSSSAQPCRVTQQRITNLHFTAPSSLAQSNLELPPDYSDMSQLAISPLVPYTSQGELEALHSSCFIYGPLQYAPCIGSPRDVGVSYDGCMSTKDSSADFQMILCIL